MYTSSVPDKMNAPGEGVVTNAGHFTMPVGGTMQTQSTDARSKEEICLEAIRSGRITIDADGRIWKHWRMNGGSKSIYNPPRRADHSDKLGYCRVGVPIARGKVMIVYAHRLVWVHHNGRIPDDKEINHIDGNKTNNSLSNLELVTRKGNQEHASRTGAWADSPNRRAEENPGAKLTWDKVREMRRRHSAGEKAASLAKAFNTCTVNVYMIVNGRSWKERANV